MLVVLGLNVHYTKQLTTTHDMEDLIALRGDFRGFFYDDLCKTLKKFKMSFRNLN